VRTVLRILKIPKSNYYYHKSRIYVEKKATEGRPVPGYSLQEDGTKVIDVQIQEWIMAFLSGEEQAYGYRKLTLMLRRKHKLIINKKKVYRLCKALHILRQQRKIKTKYPKKLARNRTITASNQLYETDIKYGYIAGEDRFLFIQCVLDVYDRNVIAYHIGLRCEATDVVRTLQTALFKRQCYESAQKMPTVRTDNGPQFISHAFEEACIDFGVEHERIPPRTPNMNAHIESFHRLLQDECLGRYDFESYAEAYTTVASYIEFYNERRIHSSIGDRSPSEFYRMNKNEQQPIKEIRV